jgi:hypothetical protein
VAHNVFVVGDIGRLHDAELSAFQQSVDATALSAPEARSRFDRFCSSVR